MRLCWLGTLVGLLLVGCDGPSPTVPATVRGRVSFQGRALAGGVIVFASHPERGPPIASTSAELDANGEFRLMLNGAAYVPAGWYRIAIADAGSGTDRFPKALARPDRSGLEREVFSGRENVFDFQIELAD